MRRGGRGTGDEFQTRLHCQFSHFKYRHVFLQVNASAIDPPRMIAQDTVPLDYLVGFYLVLP
jgi:hypothetical protein